MADPSTDTAAPANRRRGRPGYDRATVLRRAVELFNRRGYEATSMHDLATDLGVTKSALYHHFASKEDLLAAALDEALTGLTAAVDAAASNTAGGTAYDRLRATVTEGMEILSAHLPAVTLLLRVRGNSELELDAMHRRRQIGVRLSEVVRQAVADGDIRADLPPDVVSRLMFGMVNSVIDWYRPGQESDADVAHAVSTILFDGIRARDA